MSEITIKPFDPRTASPAELEICLPFHNRVRLELDPDDHLLTMGELLLRWRNIPEFVEDFSWLAYQENPKNILGFGNVAFLKTEKNRHIAEAEVHVLPEARQSGIAKKLLQEIANKTKRENRSLLVGGTSSEIPSGEVWMKKMGAKVGLVARTNQLKLSELNRDLIAQWIAQAPVEQFELGFWNQFYPDAEIAAIAQMISVMNSAPRDDLDIEDFNWTVEELRQDEAARAKRKVERWTLFVRDRKSRELAGYTEISWNSMQPDNDNQLINQRDTGVAPQYRGHGLGRWLKAAMIQKIMQERPKVARIQTGNANSNAPMLKINTEMGFKPYRDETVWQIELSKVEAYLAR